MRENDIDATWARVAAAAASIERDAAPWRRRFLDVLQDFRFLPGGRILASAGADGDGTLANCFVIRACDGSLASALETLVEARQTLLRGGGVGQDFSGYLPQAVDASAASGQALAPVAYLQHWDSMCSAVLASGVRRGAMMATLRCDHPDILRFCAAKSAPGVLSHFNLSVLVSAAFMRALAAGAEWPLVFDRTVFETLPAHDLWQRLCARAAGNGEPGVLFVDRINALNNLGYCERISATNPCGEVPLPADGACLLGSINLTRFVLQPCGEQAHLDLPAIEQTARVATRMLDNFVDIGRYPLPRQQLEMQATRRIGLGITGLADALAMLQCPYDSERARQLAADAMRTICHAAYAASIELARERGAFARLDRDRYARQPFIRALPAGLRDGIQAVGIRNSHLTAIAPTGSISLLAGNVSTGVEPIVMLQGPRSVRDADGGLRSFDISDYAFARSGLQGMPLSPQTAAHWRVGSQISAEHHLQMQAALQPHVDGAISKTVPLPVEATAAQVERILRRADELGLKGVTVFPGARAAECPAAPGGSSPR